jgi:hypothetical protein
MEKTPKWYSRATLHGHVLTGYRSENPTLRKKKMNLKVNDLATNVNKVEDELERLKDRKGEKMTVLLR